MRRPRGLQLNTARTPPRDLHLTYYRTVRKATTEAPKRLGTRGKTLLFEHLPYIRFGGSMQGVLFLIFANGDAYFYPLNDKTKGDSPTSARMITLESSNSRKFVRTPGLFLFHSSRYILQSSALAHTRALAWRALCIKRIPRVFQPH